MKNVCLTIDDLKKRVCSYNKKNWPIIEKAYNYAYKFHDGQLRESGEPYIIHPLNVAYILSKMHADSDTLCAALLHDTIEDTDSIYDDIKENFNDTVAYLVSGVTKMTKMNFQTKDYIVASNIRKIIVSISEDARIIVIKLVDRLHNMRTLEYKNKKRQQEIALETIEIYVPMAYYIGAYNIKDELENISFRYLKPDLYNDLVRRLNIIRSENKRMLNTMLRDVKRELNKDNITCSLKLRYKDPYSVYKKMLTKQTIDNIHDLLGINIITKNIKDCYLSLMHVHAMYPPVSYKFKDYIVKPKTNMYRALHTTVFASNNRLVQFQIRTREMDKMASYGVTSYWFKNRKLAFKNMQNDLEDNYQFVKSIRELDSSIKDNIEFVNQIKRELFSTNVYVRSTQGEVIELPLNATPIDYAYKIHTDIGNSMVAAIVNDVSVPFDYRLQNNDRVRIITDNKAYVEKSDWLDKVVTLHARRKIIEFIKDHEK